MEATAWRRCGGDRSAVAVLSKMTVAAWRWQLGGDSLQLGGDSLAAARRRWQRPLSTTVIMPLILPREHEDNMSTGQ